MLAHGYLKKHDMLKRRPSEKEYIKNQHNSRSETFTLPENSPRPEKGRLNPISPGKNPKKH
jgi:hypothetical protein